MRELDLSAIRARLENKSGPTYLAQPRGAGRDAGVHGIPAPRVSVAGLRVHRPRRPPHVPQADGRLARARRRGRLYASARRSDRSVRQGAGRDHPGQAAALRHRDDARRLRRRPSWSKATWAGRRRSSRTPNTRPPRAAPTSSRRARFSISTIPTVRRRSRSAARSVRGPTSPPPCRARSTRSARSAAPASACSPKPSRRRRSARRSPRCWRRSRRPSGFSTTPSRVTPSAPARRPCSAATSRRATSSIRPTSCCRSTRICSNRNRAACATRATSPIAAA